MERERIDHYLELDYPITVYRVPEGGYVAEIEDLPGCLTEGDTIDEALQRIEDARRAWIEVAYEERLEIPLPRTEQKYSGRFVIRIGKGLHRRLAEQAKREGISLNQHVATVLSAGATPEGKVSCSTIRVGTSIRSAGWSNAVYEHLMNWAPVALAGSRLAKEEKEKVAA